MVDASGIPAGDWQVWRSFIVMQRELARALDRQLQRDAGISQADYSVLLSLFESPGRRLRIGQLAESLVWEKSRVSHQVSRMESRGLLERTDCDLDARGTWIGLTREGRRTFLSASRKHAAEVRRLFFDLLDDEQKSTLLATSTRVLDELNPAECDALDADADAADATADAAEADPAPQPA